MYRTGDLARMRPDGVFEFLGRADQQIKIRGFRVELGEIETAILQHPGVRQAAVVALPSQGGDKRLVAYVASDSAVDTAEMRAFLGGKLPLHMLPAQFISLTALPLNANGKVDRRALQPNLFLNQNWKKSSPKPGVPRWESPLPHRTKLFSNSEEARSNSCVSKPTWNASWNG
jgi:acyl-coenzyme A synthetase/AMP-(fatty) acid ligase